MEKEKNKGVHETSPIFSPRCSAIPNTADASMKIYSGKHFPTSALSITIPPETSTAAPSTTEGPPGVLSPAWYWSRSAAVFGNLPSGAPEERRSLFASQARSSAPWHPPRLPFPGDSPRGEPGGWHASEFVTLVPPLGWSFSLVLTASPVDMSLRPDKPPVLPSAPPLLLRARPRGCSLLPLLLPFRLATGPPPDPAVLPGTAVALPKDLRLPDCDCCCRFCSPSPPPEE